MHGRWITLHMGVVLLAVLAGCQNQQQVEVSEVSATPDPLTRLATGDEQRSAEVNLVEQMARYRQAYEEHLELLADFYDRMGHQRKASWAEQELTHLRQGPRRSYLVVGESAGPGLRASASIEAADLLYEEGLAEFEAGKGALGGTFDMKKSKLWQAIETFEELITQYPTSDKIDDAAYQVGEIYHRYLDDPYSALVYYQRALQWDPQTALPVRFAIAQVYDDKLHDMVKALQYYEMTINLESDYLANVHKAHTRIKEITAQMR